MKNIFKSEVFYMSVEQYSSHFFLNYVLNTAHFCLLTRYFPPILSLEYLNHLQMSTRLGLNCTVLDKCYHLIRVMHSSLNVTASLTRSHLRDFNQL